MHPGHIRRFERRRMRNTLALILAGGRGSRLEHLTLWRAKPAVPFGGKFRIIDFPLSNCINSGIRSISVLTQYKAHSLIGHIQRGWGFMRGEFGEFVELLPAQQRIETSWYTGTADAVFQNLDIIRGHKAKYILILGGDHVYKMDYGEMIAFHALHNADLTVGCIEVPLAEASSFGIISVAEHARVVDFQEKPAHPQPLPGRTDAALCSMGIYVFNAEFLYEQLLKDAESPHSSHDFGRDIIPGAIANHHVVAFPFLNHETGKCAYWRDVGTVDAFWAANMELVGVTPELNLYDEDWPIWTYQAQLPPAKFVFDEDNQRGMAVDSVVSGGCIVAGATVRRSLLFSNVVVEPHSTITDSVILPDVKIGRHCKLQKVIIDKACIIEDDTVIGLDHTEDAKRFHVTPAGVVLVTPEMLGQCIHHAR